MQQLCMLKKYKGKLWNNMSNESKDEINSIIDDVMTKAGYTKNRR